MWNSWFDENPFAFCACVLPSSVLISCFLQIKFYANDKAFHSYLMRIIVVWQTKSYSQYDGSFDALFQFRSLRTCVCVVWCALGTCVRAKEFIYTLYVKLTNGTNSIWIAYCCRRSFRSFIILQLNHSLCFFCASLFQSHNLNDCCWSLYYNMNYC